MSPLTKEEIDALKLKRQFTFYEAAMLWNGMEPKGSRASLEMVFSEKSYAFYEICKAIIRAVYNGTIPMNEVLYKEIEDAKHPTVGSGAESGDYELCNPVRDGVVRKSAFKGMGMPDPYKSKISRRGLAYLALNMNVQPEFISDDVKALKKERDEGKTPKLRPVQRHKIACIEVARKIWADNPEITIADMAVCNDITNACEGKLYSEKAIRRWIKDWCPNKKPGRRPKK